jgi:hypothetical protein
MPFKPWKNTKLLWVGFKQDKIRIAIWGCLLCPIPTIKWWTLNLPLIKSCKFSTILCFWTSKVKSTCRKWIFEIHLFLQNLYNMIYLYSLIILFLLYSLGLLEETHQLLKRFKLFVCVLNKNITSKILLFYNFFSFAITHYMNFNLKATNF